MVYSPVYAGFTIPTVAYLLGHSTPTTTIAMYSHVIERRVNVTDALNVLFGKSVGKEYKEELKEA
ncbi:hypothetical protein [Desulforamulus aquiferis]|uniref:hypothetical protein n=1 Tax=Desulforamulus aquiferis TaxID=1397668 RepID=UPI0027146B94|nr:hypothetical protein [Desulforamulus aquiferis]